MFFNDGSGGRKLVEAVVDEALETGMEPSEEARRPAGSSPTGLSAGLGLIPGGLLGMGAAWCIGAIHGISPVSIRGFGFYGAALGFFLWWSLRGLADPLPVLSRWSFLVVGVLFGGVAGALTMVLSAIPQPDALIAGVVAGVVLASLHHAIAKWIP